MDLWSLLFSPGHFTDFNPHRCVHDSLFPLLASLKWLWSSSTTSIGLHATHIVHQTTVARRWRKCCTINTSCAGAKPTTSSQEFLQIGASLSKRIVVRILATLHDHSSRVHSSVAGRTITDAVGYFAGWWSRSRQKCRAYCDRADGVIHFVVFVIDADEIFAPHFRPQSRLLAGLHNQHQWMFARLIGSLTEFGCVLAVRNCYAIWCRKFDYDD